MSVSNLCCLQLLVKQSKCLRIYFVGIRLCNILYMFVFAHAQLLLGVFYYIRAVVLFEDLLKTQFVGIEPIHGIEHNGYWNKTTTLNNVEYFEPNDVTNAYHNAAL